MPADNPWPSTFGLIWPLSTAYLLWLALLLVFKLMIVDDPEITEIVRTMVGMPGNLRRFSRVYFALTLACMVTYTVLFAFVRQALDEISAHSNAEIFFICLDAEILRVILVWVTALLVRVFLSQAVATTRRHKESLPVDVEQG
jgi:hypothetical protein